MKKVSDKIAGGKIPWSWDSSAGVKMSRAEQKCLPCAGVAQWKLRLPVQFLHHYQAPQLSSCVDWLGEGWPQLLSQKTLPKLCSDCQALSHASQ